MTIHTYIYISSNPISSTFWVGPSPSPIFLKQEYTFLPGTTHQPRNAAPCSAVKPSWIETQ